MQRLKPVSLLVPLTALCVLIMPSVVGATSGGQCGSEVFINITVPDETVYLYEGFQANVTITLNDVMANGVLTFSSSSPMHFTVREADSTIVLTTSAADLPRNITVVIEGKAISLKELEISFTPEGADEPVAIDSLTIGVRRIPKLIQLIYIYILLGWIVVSYLSMGGTMEIKDIWERVRRPYGILIGLFSQFIIMPALAYVVALLLAEGDNASAVGIILVGTTPGGWLSNVFCVLLDVDIVLSITMTAVSSVVALGMMPLNLYIYSTPFTEENQRLRTPYRDLAQQLALLLIPLVVGIAISWKFPKFKKFCNYVIKPISVILIILSVALAIPADYYAFSQSPLNNWIASIIIPTFGAFFGLSFARIFGRDIRTSTTIAIETGVQNALLGRTIVGLFYPQPEADLLARVVLTVVLVTLLEGSFITVIYSIFRYALCKRRCDEMLREDDDEDEAIAVDDVEATAIEENGNENIAVANGAENRGFELK